MNTFFAGIKDDFNFAMIAMEMQQSPEEKVQSYLEAKNMEYPVSLGGNILGYGGRELPVAFVFDFDGKLIYQGRFGEEAKKKIKEALQNAPNPLTGPGPYIKLAAQAQQVRDGKEIGKVITELRAIIADKEMNDFDLLEEAQMLLFRMEEYFDKLWIKARMLEVEGCVAPAAEIYKEISETVKGDKIGDDAQKKADKILGDKNYSKEKKSWANWLVLEMTYKKIGRKNAKKNTALKKSLSRLIAEYPDTGAAGRCQELLDKIS